MSETPTEINRNKIRLGLAIISVVVIACVVGIVLVDDKLAKVVFLAVTLVAIVRLFLVVRSTRKEIGPLSK